MKIDREQLLKDLHAVATATMWLSVIILLICLPAGLAYFFYDKTVTEAVIDTFIFWSLFATIFVLVDDYLPAIKSRYTIQEQNRS